ncbi:unnamed protein product [Urochloa humidicola]
MGNRVARLATPCFAPADGHRGDGVTAAAADAQYTNGGLDDDTSSIGHILSFDGREGPAFAGAIHGVLLPSNQSTLGSGSGGGGGGGGSGVLNNDLQMPSFSGSSSFDSSNSFSFRKLQPQQYSGPLEPPYGASSSSSMSSASATTSGVSSMSRHPPRTDEQILADLRAVRQRRQCLQASSSKPNPVLASLRRAVTSVLRAGPCVSPARTTNHDCRRDGDHVAVAAVAGNGNGNGEAAPAEDGAAARVQWARGKAGEDRVHVVVSEEHGWMFVGIYDGFNGPDATDYLVENLYAAVCRELGGEREWEEEEVKEALARALKGTEAAFFAEAEARAAECPELAMMGSCVLVVLIRGADVYVMNVGDSRAVLAQRGGADDEEIMGELAALQLTMDHSTSVYKEARRVRSEHLDDPACIVNDRVKGSLKVTRAFGAGYLKEPRWNDALLEVFRVKYVGAAPYISCRPHLRRHRLGSRDKFMILSSDGLYDYFTNEEVVMRVEAFTARYPDEDPAKYLSHEILLRAANQAGMEFHELLEVQQGDRRRYHDDVSIIIISLEGKIWRSS